MSWDYVFSENEWSSKRMEVTYDEARAVLESQQDILSDIDDKALKNVRITTIILGVFVSAAQLTDITFSRSWAIVAGAAILISLGAGILTYNETDPYLGPNEDYIDQLRENDFDDTDWEDDLTETLGGFINENAGDIRRNGQFLSVAQAALFVGVASATVAVVI